MESTILGSSNILRKTNNYVEPIFRPGLLLRSSSMVNEINKW
ncbi:MAG: hypothetical protein ACPGXK_13445 [Phycisphaerae bacterium]